MRTFVRRVRVSPSMAVAFIALLIALGGSSYAVVRVPTHSVGSKQLKAKAVGRANIKNGAVNGTKVANDSLTGADIVESSLGQVPSAAKAATSTALDKVSYKAATGAVPPAPSATESSTAVVSAFCDPGQHVTGGGVKLDDITNTAIVDSYPDFGGTVWTAHVDNADATAAHGFTIYAICVQSAAAG